MIKEQLNIKRKSILLIAFVFFGFSQIASAQNLIIRGQVKSEAGELLPSVSIQAKGSKKGTSTDFDGNYKIRMPKEATTLTFRYLGYKTVEVVVGSNPIINVTLKQELNVLDDIVVVGYGTQNRKDVTGAITSIKSKELERTVNNNLGDALQGKISGVQITHEDGTPGGAFKVNIRGAAAITGSTQPLYVVDGFPIEVFDDTSDEGNPYDGASNGNPLDFLDPSMIESLEVLKDASATAIYGARGANGVVIITTKQGKAGEVKVSYRMSTSLSKTPENRIVDVFDNGEYADFLINNEYYNLDNWDKSAGDVQTWTPIADRNSYLIKNPFPADPEVEEFITRDEFAALSSTDWMREILSVGKVDNHVLTVSGGTPENLFSFTGSYMKNESVVVGAGFDRFVLNVKLKNKIGKRLTAQTVLSPSYSKQYGSGGGGGNSGAANQAGVFTRALTTPPFMIPGDVTTNVNDDNEEEITYNDPVFQLENEIRNRKKMGFRASTKLAYKFSEALVGNVSFGLNYGINEQREYYPPTFGTGNRPNYNGFARRVDGKSTSFNNVNTLNYKKKFGKHRINALVGYTQNSRSQNNFAQSARGFADDVADGSIDYDLAASYDKSRIRNQEINQIGYLGRINYVFNNKYSFTGSIRRDGDSRFALSKSPYRNFPSAAFAWTASKEKFMQNLNFVDNLKFRLSYGLGGNSGVRPQDSRESYTQFAYNFGGVSYAGYGNRLLVDRDLTWQSARQYDFGMDLSMFDSRVKITYDMYLKQTVDMILDRAVGLNIGYDIIRTNAGDLDNWGVELALETHNIKSDEFNWTTNLTIAADRSKILSLGGPQLKTFESRGIRGQSGALIVGENIGTWIGYESDGVYNSQNEIDNDISLSQDYRDGLQPGDMKYIDQDGDGAITDKDGNAVIGRTQAKFHGGMWNNFEIGDFELGLFFTFKYGFDVINGDRYAFSYVTPGSNNQMNTALYNAWTPENPERNNPGYNYVHGLRDRPEKFSSYHIEDGSFLRLQNVSFKYNFPQEVLKKSFINNLSLSFNITNAFLWTKYTGSDPENSVSRGRFGHLTPNLDFASFPRARNWNTTLNIGF